MIRKSSKKLSKDVANILEKVKRTQETKIVQKYKRRLDKCMKLNCPDKNKTCIQEKCLRETKKYKKAFDREYAKMN